MVSTLRPLFDIWDLRRFGVPILSGTQDSLKCVTHRLKMLRNTMQDNTMRHIDAILPGPVGSVRFETVPAITGTVRRAL
jgi:hypothetical protein